MPSQPWTRHRRRQAARPDARIKAVRQSRQDGAGGQQRAAQAAQSEGGAPAGHSSAWPSRAAGCAAAVQAHDASARLGACRARLLSARQCATQEAPRGETPCPQRAPVRGSAGAQRGDEEDALPQPRAAQHEAQQRVRSLRRRSDPAPFCNGPRQRTAHVTAICRIQRSRCAFSRSRFFALSLAISHAAGGRGARAVPPRLRRCAPPALLPAPPAPRCAQPLWLGGCRSAGCRLSGVHSRGVLLGANVGRGERGRQRGRQH